MILSNGNTHELEQLINTRETFLPGLNLVKRSLHKSIYDFGETLLIVANDQFFNNNTNKIEYIPGKGQIVTKQSVDWFETLSDLCPNHYISSDIPRFS